MSRSFPPLALGLLLVLSAGCSDAVQPEPPTAQPEPPTVASPEPPLTAQQDFPALSRPGVIFNGAGAIYPPTAYHEGALTSRYVLYQDGSFGLQLLSPKFGFFEYTGHYVRMESHVALNFNASNLAGPWVATGNLRGDVLTVSYNIVMLLADFSDGAYLRPT